MLDFLKSRRRKAANKTSLLKDLLPGFDKDYYLGNNPDVQAKSVDPAKHFLEHGWKEGRDPSWGFSLSGYLQCNPDVRDAGINPLIHFLQFGITEGRNYRWPAATQSAGAVEEPEPEPAGVMVRSQSLSGAVDHAAAFGDGHVMDRRSLRSGSAQRIAKTSIVLGYDPPAD